MSDEGVATRVSQNLGDVAPSSETTVREALARDDLRRGVETTQSLYGAEVFGFMTAVLDDPTIARDVYVRFAERLWRSLGRFRWHCSLRTWCYALARSEIARRRAQTVTSPALPPPPPSPRPSAGGAPEVELPQRVDDCEVHAPRWRRSPAVPARAGGQGASRLAR